MSNVEMIGFAMFIVKYFILLLIGFKVYNIISTVLVKLTDEQILSYVIALFAALLTIYIVREMFLLFLIVVLIVLYILGYINKVTKIFKVN